jgi:hypothetical protein
MPSTIIQKATTFETFIGVGGVHFINWDEAERLPDPTRVFSLLVLAIMSVRFALAEGLQALLFGFYLNPYVLVFFSLAVAVAVVAKKNSHGAVLPVYDRWTAEWYWWNAWLFHMVMDGASGTFRLVPVVVHQYDIMDLRFPNHHVVPWMIGWMELFLHGPLCLMTLYAVITKSPFRYSLELITSTLQFVGMVIFIGAEVYEGQMNVPALDPVGSETGIKLKLNLYHLTYYWFAFWFCNLVWGFVPYWRIMRAVEECRVKFADESSSETTKGKKLK